MECWLAKTTELKMNATWNVHVENLDDKKADASFFRCVFMSAICSWHQVGDTIKVISAICQSSRKMQTWTTIFSLIKNMSQAPTVCSNTGADLPNTSPSLLPCFTSPHVKRPLLLLTAHCAQLSAALRLIYGSPHPSPSLSPSAAMM